MKKLILLLASLLLPTVAGAQTSTVPTGAAFTVTATHDGVNVVGLTGSGYRCYQDGVKVGADLPPTVLLSGVVTCSYPAIATAGAHTVAVSAFNATAEVKSAALAFTTASPLPPPAGPGGLHIIVNGVIVAEDGTQTPAQLTLSVIATK